VGAANVAQQALRAGRIDELLVDLVPVLLGGDIRSPDERRMELIAPEIMRVVAAPGVTHLRCRVVKH
jgi:dihydrofolate reductase